MRLVDADSITLDISMYREFEIGMPLENRLRIMLAKQPTVKAIPIEWIKRYVQKLEIRLKDNLDLGEYGPVCEIVTIEDMLERWEKENEQ